MKNTKIYALSSSGSPDNIRYIGKTACSLSYRLSRHVYYNTNNKTHKGNWIRKEINSGNKILIKELFVVPKNDDWEKWEIHFISEYKKMGYKLTNGTIGGEGLHREDNPFFGKIHKKSSIEKNKLNQPYRKNVDQYDLDGNLINSFNSIREASESINIPVSSISDVCKQKPKYKTAGGFVWRLPGEPFSLEYSNPSEHLRKIVCQYNKSGNLLNEYKSVSAAAKTNSVSPGNISRCCNGDIKTVGGYIWKFKGDKFSYDNIRSDAKSVAQYTLSGAYVNEFKSVSEASRKTGIYYSGIYQCCKGEYKDAGGFRWKFSNP